MSSETITRNDLRSILNGILPMDIETIYRNSTEKTITTAGVDVTPTVGASVTLPKDHVYLIIGQWTFNSGSSSATRNNQVVIKDMTAGVNKATQRILYANQSFAIMQVSYITDKLTVDTEFAVCASSSMTYTTASNNNIVAIPLLETSSSEGGGGAVDATAIPTANKVAKFDATAYMNSTDMTSTEVSDFVDDLDYENEVATVVSNMVDYIVEQGTSGIWTYRKWNSGVAECWGITSYASATFSAAGNSFMRGFADIMLPTNLFNIAPIVFVNPVFGNVGSARTGSISASKFNVAVLSTISNASEVELQLFAKGTWK